MTLGLFAGRPRAEQRQAGIDPRPMADNLYGLLGRSYQDIDLSTAENALQIVAVRSAVDLITSVVSELPVNVFRGEGRDRKKLTTPSVLDDPSGEGYGREDWISQVLMSWLLRGNLYGHKLATRGDVLQQVLPFHPDTVNPRPDGQGKWTWTVIGQDFPASEMLHMRVNPVPGRLLGMSPIAAHIDSLGLSMSVTRHGLNWFQSGGHPGGILSNSDIDMTEEVARTAKDRFMAALRGNREPVTLGKGWSYQQVQVAPEESQFLQTANYSAAEAAKIFGPGVAEVLGYTTTTSMTYTNMVDRDLALLKYSINKWVTRIERLLSQFLPRPQVVVLDRDAFLETNALERWRKHALATTTGAITPNEIRDVEHMLPVEWGDVPWVPAKAAAPADDQPADPADKNEDPGASDPTQDPAKDGASK